MTDAAQIRRVELMLALLGLTAAIAALIVTLDAVRFHAASLLAALEGRPVGVHAEEIAVLALAGASTIAVVLALRSGTRSCSLSVPAWEA